MRKILLAGLLIFSRLAIQCSPVKAEITERQGITLLGEACVAYGVKGYSLNSIKILVRGKIDKLDNISSKESRGIANSRTRELTIDSIIDYRQKSTDLIIDAVAKNCVPGSTEAKHYSNIGIQAIGETD